MKKIKRLFAVMLSTLAVMSGTALCSFAATVDLPPEFSDFVPIIEFILKIVEAVSKFVSFFSFS